MIRDAYDIHRVLSREQLDAYAQRSLFALGVNQTHQASEPAAAYVNHGRWVIDCACGNGVLVSPRDSDVICWECGAVITVTFPTGGDIAAAAEILDVRLSLTARNWHPDTETVTQLADENERRRLPRGTETN